MHNNDEKLQVRCDVENCTYNKERSCHASSIKVGSCGDNQVQSCEGTKCSTFKKEDSYSM